MQSATRDRVTVRIHGEIDLATGPELDATIRQAERHGPARIELDCSELEFIDMAGVRVLLGAQQRAAQNGHRLVLAQVPANARRLFELTGTGATLELQ